MEQKERLNYLVKAFISDSEEYSHLQPSADEKQNKVLLRSLMNIRMPKPMDPEVLGIQDDYLRQRNRENGIVGASDIRTVSASGSDVPFADTLAIWQGDITRLELDAIVNAANSQMLGCFIPMHTCIDNCIHTYAGIQLRAACNQEMRKLRALHGNDYEQPVAVPMLTDGYNLPAGKVIHIVGPIVKDRLTKELEEDLAACYANTLDLCHANGLKTVAFCCLSTGVFRFPKKRAAEIAVSSVIQWLTDHPDTMEKIVFNVFGDEDKYCYEKILL